MDSDSDSNSSVHGSETAAFRSSATIPPFPSLDYPQFERGSRGEQFLIDNELASYVNGKPKKLKETDKTFNPIDWWIRKKTTYPTLYQYALDTLSCPATSTECERVFNSTKKLLTPERNQLMEDIVEACECLKAWRKKELIQQQKG